ncbi:MAG: L-threonylcarbamoyladenylate synthase type 1 TsaC, partial [Betaproteobacteria bacterium]|nr:L-threonylcarbamoyladenylate synthase type 1 TsaC [Betaproteobacteria bacterium]
GGPCEVGLESTVLSLEPLLILRPGGVSLQQLESSLGRRIPTATKPHAGLSEQAQRAPGMLASHYSPRKPLALVDHLDSSAPEAGVGALAWNSSSTGALQGYAHVDSLSDREGTHEQRCAKAAHRLFAALRELDEHPDVARIIAERCPHAEGLGHAINDRLVRAAAPK